MTPFEYSVTRKVARALSDASGAIYDAAELQCELKRPHEVVRIMRLWTRLSSELRRKENALWHYEANNTNDVLAAELEAIEE